MKCLSVLIEKMQNGLPLHGRPYILNSQQERDLEIVQLALL